MDSGSTSNMEQQKRSDLQDKGAEDVISKLDTVEILDSADEAKRESFEVDTALDEAMDLEDVIFISLSEKPVQIKDTPSKTVDPQQGLVGREVVREPKEIKSGRVYQFRADLLNDYEDVPMRVESGNDQHQATVDKILAEDKTVGKEKDTSIQERVEIVGKEVKEDSQKEALLAESIKEPIRVEEVQLETQILAEDKLAKANFAFEVEAKTEQSTEGDNDLVVTVEASILNNVDKKSENEDKENVKRNFPVSEISEEKCVLHESKSVVGPAEVKLEATPKVSALINPPVAVKTVSGPKPCDLITKDMVPSMTEGRVEMAVKLSEQIEFRKGVTPLALQSMSTWLVQQVDATLVPTSTQSVMSFMRSFRRTQYHLILFHETLVVCKKKEGSRFVALNYCQRNLVLASKASSMDRLPEKIRKDTAGKSKIYLTLLENHEQKEESMVLSFSNRLERDEWIQLFKTPASSNQTEVVYELWDCPLVKVVQDFEATKPEEMTVHKDEKINVIRKFSNRFYEGERIKDLQRGLVPISATVELSSEHSRAHKIRDNFNKTTF